MVRLIYYIARNDKLIVVRHTPIDIVTHLGICSSTDPSSANRFLVSDFVTASQAQRKFFSKVVSKITKGSYRLGAVSRILGSNLTFVTKLIDTMPVAARTLPIS